MDGGATWLLHAQRNALVFADIFVPDVGMRRNVVANQRGALC